MNEQFVVHEQINTRGHHVFSLEKTRWQQAQFQTRGLKPQGLHEFLMLRHTGSGKLDNSTVSLQAWQTKLSRNAVLTVNAFAIGLQFRQDLFFIYDHNFFCFWMCKVMLW